MKNEQSWSNVTGATCISVYNIGNSQREPKLEALASLASTQLQINVVGVHTTPN